jgi:hypothetical protein
MVNQQYPHPSLQHSQQKTKSEVTANTVHLYLEAIQSNIDPASIASLFSKGVDFYIPGNTEAVPWAGRHKGRIGVTNFIRNLRTKIETVDFLVRSILVDGEQAHIFGIYKIAR